MVYKWLTQLCSDFVISPIFPLPRDQMNSGITTVKYSESEPESAKKESILIPIENQCRHFIFSLVLVEVMDSQT